MFTSRSQSIHAKKKPLWFLVINSSCIPPPCFILPNHLSMLKWLTRTEFGVFALIIFQNVSFYFLLYKRWCFYVLCFFIIPILVGLSRYLANSILELFFGRRYILCLDINADGGVHLHSFVKWIQILSLLLSLLQAPVVIDYFFDTLIQNQPTMEC